MVWRVDVFGEGKLSDQELQSQLKAYRLYLMREGYKSGKPGPLEIRMDGATQFARFLAGRPLRYKESLPDDWRGY